MLAAEPAVQQTIASDLVPLAPWHNAADRGRPRIGRDRGESGPCLALPCFEHRPVVHDILQPPGAPGVLCSAPFAIDASRATQPPYPVGSRRDCRYALSP